MSSLNSEPSSGSNVGDLQPQLEVGNDGGPPQTPEPQQSPKRGTSGSNRDDFNVPHNNSLSGEEDLAEIILFSFRI